MTSSIIFWYMYSTRSYASQNQQEEEQNKETH
jgi:hypothetical protein